MHEKNKVFSLRNIVLVGVLAAMVFPLTKFASIPIPSPLGKTALSLGNSMSILGGLLFGPAIGGLAAGIGNALVDLSDPAWAPEFWITFINKFLMAFVAGLLMRKLRALAPKVRIWVAGICGSLTYVLLYITKNILTGVLVKGFAWKVAIVETLSVKLPVSVANGVIAVVVAALFYMAIHPALCKAGFLHKED